MIGFYWEKRDWMLEEDLRKSGKGESSRNFNIFLRKLETIQKKHRWILIFEREKF